MIYKPGQKVKIKRHLDASYNPDAWQALEKYDYVFTIKKKLDADIRNKYYYDMEEETGYRWHEKFIEGLYEEPQDPKELINDRFEILDL